MALKNPKSDAPAAKGKEKKKNSSPEGPSKVAQAVTYFEESKAELKKVTWPTRKEVKVTSIAVLVLVAIMSVFLGLVDLVLVKVVEMITYLGS